MNHEYMYPKVTPLRDGMAALVPASRHEAAAETGKQGEPPPAVQASVAPGQAVVLTAPELG